MTGAIARLDDLGARRRHGASSASRCQANERPLPVTAAPAPAGAERNRYLDLLRAVALCGVVYGHWLLVDITYRAGQLSGRDALDYIEWGRWVTWVSQVMPVFFLVGGYVNAQSWRAHYACEEGWTWWVRDAGMATAAALMDKGMVGSRLQVIGYANYLLVWGSVYQWGFAWRDGSLSPPGGARTC